MNLHKVTIPVIDVYVTGQCNYACQYCFGENDQSPSLSLDLYARILDFANYIGAKISFTGGEPLLHPHIEELVFMSQKSNISLILRTNAMLLENYLHLHNAFDWIGISLDGTETINHQMRPNARGFTYTKEQKINTPLDVIKEIKTVHPNIKILLATIATSSNIHNILDLAKLLKEKETPIDLWKIYQFTSNNFRSLNTRNKFQIFTQQLIEVESIIKNELSLNIKVKYGEGNCLLIDTVGNISVNGKNIGNVKNSFPCLVDKIISSSAFKDIILNKQSTYESD